MLIRSAIFTIAGAALLTAVHAQPASVPNAGLAIGPEPIASPAGADSSEPQITTGDGHTILSWIEASGGHPSLKFAERTATGWTPARTATAGADLMLNSSDVPSVIRLANNATV